MTGRRKPASRIAIVRQRGQDLLDVLIAHRDCGTPVATLCERATTAVDEFSEILSDNLVQASVSRSERNPERLRVKYVRILGDFAAAVLDVISDPEARHVLAQAIQCAVLRHERRLREVTSAAVHS